MFGRTESASGKASLRITIVAVAIVLIVVAAFSLHQRRTTAVLATDIDASGDTIVARTIGDFPDTVSRRLLTEVTIAPGVNDTSLFTEISEVDVDGRGQIWVYDTPTNTIVLFDSAGKKLLRVGRAGEGPGEFRGNGGMVAMNDGRLAQWDPSNARINFVSPSGQVETSWPVRGGFGSNNNLVTDSAGNLFTRRPSYGRGMSSTQARNDAGVLVRYKDGGDFGDTLKPSVFEMPDFTYRASDASGRFITQSARWAPRSVWAWHPYGFFVVGDGHRYHIVLSLPAAKPIRIERVMRAQEIPAEEQRMNEAYLTVMMRSFDPNWVRHGEALPTTKPLLEDIFVARDGKIWARVPGASERITDGDVPPERVGLPAGPPIQTFQSNDSWEIFSTSGIFLGTVPIPRGADLVQAYGNRIWVVIRDDNGMPMVTRMRVDPPLAR